MLRTLILAFLITAMLCSVSSAADLHKITEKFYGGLADIIENNMDAPEQCLRLVEQYYQDNQAVIVKIREEAAKAMAQAAPMMSEMMDAAFSMDEEKLKSLEKKYEGMQQRALSRLKYS